MSKWTLFASTRQVRLRQMSLSVPCTSGTLRPGTSTWSLIKLADWSTRGWTLQEGATARALCISSDRGASFVELLSNTGWEDDKVRALALKASYTPTSSMYWINLMDSRQTTKVEDKAYALIGLLGLDFQSAYGEGKSSMNRLCDELTRQKRDVSWLMRDAFRNGNWATPSHARTGTQYKISMDEVCYRCNLVVSYDEIQVIGPALKMDAVEVRDVYLEALRTVTIHRAFSYGATFEIAYSCKNSLKKIKSDITYWWIPSNNIILQLCRYKTTTNPGKFWRIISVRGAPDKWTPPSLTHLTNIVVDYNTTVYKPDFGLEEIEPEHVNGSQPSSKPSTPRGSVFGSVMDENEE